MKAAEPVAEAPIPQATSGVAGSIYTLLGKCCTGLVQAVADHEAQGNEVEYQALGGYGLGEAALHGASDMEINIVALHLLVYHESLILNCKAVQSIMPPEVKEAMKKVAGDD